MLSGLTLCDFLNEKITIPNGLYCIEDISSLLKNTKTIPLKLSKESKYIILAIDNFKEKEFVFLLKLLSHNNIYLRFDDRGSPYFEIETIEKMPESFKKQEITTISIFFDNTDIKDVFNLFANIMNKKLLMKTEKNIKVNIKCKAGIPIEYIFDEVIKFYNLKVSINDDEIIVE